MVKKSAFALFIYMSDCVCCVVDIISFWYGFTIQMISCDDSMIDRIYTLFGTNIC